MDDLVANLKAWGMATAARMAKQTDGQSHGDSVLRKSIDNIFPNRKPKVEHVPLGRSGVARRARMAQAANAGLGKNARAVGHMVPTWSCDPVPAKNDAGAPREISKGFVDIGLPDHVLSIDAAIRSLERQPNGVLRAMIVREEYTGTGTQKMKAARVAAKYGGKLTRKQYQAELYKSQEFLRGRVAL